MNNYINYDPFYYNMYHHQGEREEGEVVILCLGREKSDMDKYLEYRKERYHEAITGTFIILGVLIAILFFKGLERYR